MTSAIRFVWVTVCAVISIAAMASPAQDEQLALTPEESAWVKKHPVVRVGYDPNWPPFTMKDEAGNFIGLDADMLQTMGRRLGLRFEPVAHASWTAAYEAGVGGQVDILAGTASTPERERHFHFTNAYISFPVGIVTRGSEDFLWSVFDLEGRTVATPRGYVATLELAREYPGIRLLETADTAEALEAVSHGQADAMVTNLANASFIIKTRGLTNLKISGVMPERFDLRYAVRQDWPELVGLLDKAIASLTRADLQALDHRWVRVDYAKVIRWDLVWKTAAAALAVLGTVIGFLIWHYRAVRIELAKRKLVQQALEAANSRLNISNAALKSQHEEITELMHVAAHDLRNPLTALTLGADFFRQSLPGPERAQAEVMFNTARQMMCLIDDLLEVHALEQGQREFTLVELDVREQLQHSAASLEPLARRKRSRFDFSCADAALRVLGDTRALRQVFDNLLSNAVKFSPPESVIRIRVAKWNDFVRVDVIDQGPGVPVEERERIFTKYARGTARPTAGESSTGLGLAIVRETVSAHNGRVWCENVESGGACFVIALPSYRAV